MESAPDWFRREIAAGLVRLVALSLPGQPPAETIEATREVWIDALWPTRAWLEEPDIPRLREAFRRLSIHCERWPAPRLFHEFLPDRPAPKQLDLPEPTPEERARIAARMREFLEAMRDKSDSGERAG